MKIAVIGTGYVGLVTGTCLAERATTSRASIATRRRSRCSSGGTIPIYEPGLAELVGRNVKEGRLHFTTDLAAAVRTAKLVFLAVGTPPADDGSADLSALWAVVEGIAPHLARGAIVVCKSTVPVGTNAAVTARLAELTGRAVRRGQQPEFLKEGAAIDDFMKPDRVVVGARSREVYDVLWDLYQPYLRTDKPLLVMSPESAEMTKYVANALLSTKISFINEIANVCERTGADINEVRRGIGHDSRIGFAFLFPGVRLWRQLFSQGRAGVGVGGPRCTASTPRILDAVHEVNDAAEGGDPAKRCEQHFEGQLAGKTDRRLGTGVQARHGRYPRGAGAGADRPPAGRRRETSACTTRRRWTTSARIYGDRLVYCKKRDDALEGADALAICTEWKAVRPTGLRADARLHASGR